jgi:hypothetical protein
VVEQLVVGEALELDVPDQVVPSDRVQAPGLDRRVVQVDVDVEVRHPERGHAPIATCVRRILMPIDRHTGLRQLDDDGVVDGDEGVAEQLADDRQDLRLHGDVAERPVVCPDAVGAEVAVAAVEVAVAVARPLAGNAHRHGAVHGGPQRCDLRPVEHAMHDQEAVAVEPVDRCLVEHRSSIVDRIPRSMSTVGTAFLSGQD